MIRRSSRLLVVAALATFGLVATGSGSPVGAAPQAFVTVDGEGTCQLATVDLDTGQGTPIGDVKDFNCLDLAFASDGTLYGLVDIDNIANLGTWNTTTGAFTNIGPVDHLSGDFQLGGITFDAAGTLFALLYEPAPNGQGAQQTGCPTGDFNGPFCLFQVDPADPSTPTLVGQTTEETRVAGLDVGCTAPAVTLENNDAGDRAVEAPEGVEVPDGEVGTEDHGPSANAYLDAVDLTTGARTQIGAGVGEDILIRSLAYDADEALWGVGYDDSDTDAVEAPDATQVGNDRVYTIDQSTGTATEHADLHIEGVDHDYVAPSGLAIAPLVCELVVAFTG